MNQVEHQHLYLFFSYIVESREAGTFKWQRAQDKLIKDTSFTVERLLQDTEYEFRVSAENKAGVGPASETTLAVKVKEPGSE